MTNIKTTCFFFCIFLLSNSAIFAQEKDKNSQSDKKKIKNKTPAWLLAVKTDSPGKHKKIDDCQFYYTMSWSNILIAGITKLKIKNTSNMLKAEAEGHSAGLARIFWKFDFSYKSLINKITLYPKKAQLKMLENKEITDISNDYFSEKLICKRVITQKKTSKKKNNIKKFNLPNTHGIASAVLYLRSFDYKIGETFNLIIWPQDDSYLLSLKTLKKENRKYDFGIVPTICFEVIIQKIKGKKHNKLQQYKKAKKSKIWLSDDKFRMPLEIRSDVFIGEVICTLKKRIKTASKTTKIKQ